jgi:hypothetical protein
MQSRNAQIFTNFRVLFIHTFTQTINKKYSLLNNYSNQSTMPENIWKISSDSDNTEGKSYARGA